MCFLLFPFHFISASSVGVSEYLEISISFFFGYTTISFSLRQPFSHKVRSTNRFAQIAMKNNNKERNEKEEPTTIRFRNTRTQVVSGVECAERESVASAERR
jgi:hypothetical protein